MLVDRNPFQPRLSTSPFVFCEIYGYCMTFEETASPVFSETIPLTPECLWYNELQYVSNFNLTVQVTDGYKYNDLEQVYFQPWIIKSFDDYFACHCEVSPQVFQFPLTTSFLWLRKYLGSTHGRTSHTP